MCAGRICILFFFFNDTATTEIYTLSLHDALPIFEEGLIGAVAVTYVEWARNDLKKVIVPWTLLQSEIGRAHV